MAALSGCVSGLKECAATPPNSARVAGDFQRRATSVAGIAAGIPKRARRIGCFGRCRIGRSASSFSSSKCCAGERKSRPQARPSSPRPAIVSSIDRTIVAALPSSKGCARSISGQRHSRPCFSSSSERKKGEAAAIGCPAEQTSWIRPGTVSSALRVPPPIVSAASSTVTSTPARASATAQARPLGPEPTTVAVLTGRAPPTAAEPRVRSPRPGNPMTLPARAGV